MLTIQNSKSFRHFAKHLFLIGKIYVERNKAKEDIYKHLEKMKKSIIKMRLSYTDISKLKEKIEKLINLDAKYAKFFKPEDKETQELKRQINALEKELGNEREEKQRIIYESDEKIKQLTESLNNIKSQIRHLFLEKTRRHHRLKSLEQKIRQKVDVHKYYRS